MITHQPVNNHDDMLKALDNVLSDAGLDRSDLDGNVTFAGLDPIRPTPIKVAAGGSIVGAADALASALIWQMRSGEGQDIHADLRKVYTIQSAFQQGLEHCTMLNGVSVMLNPNQYGGGAFAPCKDGRSVYYSMMYPSQIHKMLKLLGCGMSPDQVAQATRKWEAADLEAAGTAAMLPLHMVRTQEEFQATEHWEYHSQTPLIHIEKIGDSEPEPFTPADRPLSGIRVMGFWHVIAGPTIARQLAAQGADCMNLCSPYWQEERMFYYQADTGSRQAMLDGRDPANMKRVYELVKDADVFIENLRPGLVNDEGFGAEELAQYRPGLIYVRVKLMTATGPWSGWPGFDTNAEAIAGIQTAEGTPEAPRKPRATMLTVDFPTGYLGAIGAQAALLRRAKEGGSYRVSVTLSQTATFLLSLGLVDKNMLLDIESLGEEHQRLEPDLVTGQTPLGEFTRLGPQVEMSKTPGYWADPMIYPQASCKPEWLPR